MEHKPFDYEAFKAGFRNACEQRGVDPVEGATSYQVALYKAEQVKKAGWRQSSNWWKRARLWKHEGSLNPASIWWQHASHDTSDSPEKEDDNGNEVHSGNRVRRVLSRMTENAAITNIYEQAKLHELDRWVRILQVQVG